MSKISGRDFIDRLRTIIDVPDGIKSVSISASHDGACNVEFVCIATDSHKCINERLDKGLKESDKRLVR